MPNNLYTLSLQEFLIQHGEEDDGDEDDNDDDNGGMVELEAKTGFYLHRELRGKLYAHQKEGVLWMWKLHKKKKGGILADDMG